MVGMGSSSSSGTPEGETASGESIPLLRHPLLWGGIGTIALFAAVTGAIINLPDPTASKPGDKRYVGPKYTSDEAAAAAGERLARERLEKWHDEQAQKMKYHLSFDLSPEARRYAKKMLKEHQQPVVLTPEEAANARSKLSVQGRLVTDDYEESPPVWLPSGRMATHNAEYVKYRDPKCEDERSFLIELLTDSQLDEFMEYIERDEEDDGEYYRAETLKKNSCCCGATVINPCACMIEGVMDCSAVEPKCPCYEWPSNVNSPIELDNYESKCPRCKTDLTEEWWDEVHGEELGDWEVEEGGRAKYYRTWYGNCPSCRSYFELPDYYYDHGESMVGWEPSYINRAESFARWPFGELPRWADDREKWHSLSEVIYDDGGNRICGCRDDDLVEECCIMDPRPYNKENLRKAINNLSEIGRRELIARFEIEDLHEDGDGLENFIEGDYWWMNDPSILSNRSKIGEYFGDVWDWLDEYGNMSDQEWIKLLGPDAPSVKPPEPPPTCAGCGVEDIEFYHDYYGGFCGGDCFDGYLEENNLENYSRTEKDLDAESVVKEYNPEKMIPIGTKVRSYDFWPHDKTCYKEGLIVDHAPSPSCSPHCLHYHIRTTKVIRRGKSRAVDEGEIFMTHPYADVFDEDYYAGKLAPHIQVISTAFPSTSGQ